MIAAAASQPRRGTARRRVGVGALIGLLLASLAAWPASVAASQPLGQFLWWTDEGDGYRQFGPNADVTIHTGAMAFVNSCALGVNDFIFPFTDIYIVRRGSVSDGTGLLTQALASVKTVEGVGGGLFGDALIGFTFPTNQNLPEGEYAIVYDECQDGYFNAGTDALFDPAFRVEIGATTVPLLPLDLTAMKAEAFTQAQVYAGMDVFMNVLAQANTLSPSTWQTSIGIVTSLTGVFLDDPVAVLSTHLRNMVRHYLALHADPPDPAFAQPTTVLNPTPGVEPRDGSPALAAAAALATEAGAEAALIEAFVHSLERYQGAAAVSDGTWALAHARAMADTALDVDAQLERTAAALDDLADEADAQAADLDGAAAALIDLRDRLATDALTDDERLLFRSLGLADDLDVILDDLVAMNLDAFDAASSADDLRQAATDSRAARATWQSFSAAMSDIVATLVADPTVEDLVPVALPGGPYAAVAGTPVGLAGGGTSGGTPIVAYAWDLDLDGDFDDAAGATPTVTFDAARAGVIGLRVSDGDGRHGVAYAPIVVTWPGAPPQIDARTPLSDPVEVLVGASQAFSVTVSDPDGPTPTVEWLLDGATAATGLTYQLDTTTADLGTHVVEAVADDGSRQRLTSWAVGVRAPDGDGDGWPSNLDCNDGAAAVNPGATEIALNGVDDDCDPGTSDDGLGPTAAFVSSAPAGGRNVALFDVGPAGSTPSAVSAIVMAESPAHASNWAMSAALDAEPEGPSWAAGPAALRYGVVRLWGNATWLIDRIAITPRIDFQPQRVRDFAVDVSTTGFASEADWTQVLSATAVDSGALQSFVLPGGPVAAKYVRVRLLSNRGDPTYISVSEFKVYSPQQSAGPTFDFEDRSSDPEDDIISRSWDFGDGSASSLTNPSHTYSAPGAYTVTLTVTDSRGHTNSTTLVHRVLTPPTASFGQPATIFERESAFVTPSASDPDGERIVRIRWSWGDGSPDTVLPHLSFHGHQYLQDGTYTIRLTATDAQEQTAISERTVTVLNVAPTATLPNRTVASGIRYTYSAVASDVADPITCTWDFGDGSPTETGCGARVHAYPALAAGSPDVQYTQSITVADDDTTITRTATIRVVARLSDRTVRDGLPLTYDPPSFLAPPPAGVTCAWNFGDGSPVVTGCGSKVHAYPAMAPGSPDALFTQTLTVTDSGGSAALAGTITVHGEVVAPYFSTNFDTGAPPEFSGVTTTEGVQGYADYGFGGLFLRNGAVPTQPTTLTLTGLPEHTSVDIAFVLAIIDSWDGNFCGAGPDRLTIRVDGVARFSEVFENSNCGSQTYVPPANVTLARRLSLGFTPTGSFYADSAYDMGFDPAFRAIPHTGSTLTVEFLASGVLQGIGDESWAVDNFEVFLNGVPDTNDAPTAEAGGPYTVTEGESVLVDASGSSDSDGDTLTYAWDLDDDGAFDDATGATATFAALEGPAAHTVHVRVTDSTNLAATDSATVSVLNAPPSGTFDATGTILEGDSATLAWTAATDPSTTDAAALRYSFSCDATQAQPTTSWALAGTSSTTSCTYADDGLVNVIGRVLDPQNASATTGAIVTITNVAPTATFVVPPTSDEGGSFLLSLVDHDDPSATDTAAGFEFSFDCGDGAGFGAWSTAASTSCDALDDDGVQSVRARIRDKDAGVRTYDDTLSVRNVPPSVTLSNDGPAPWGISVDLVAVAEDPSSDDFAALTYEWDLDGDGTFETSPSSSASRTATYASPGSVTARVRVCDDRDCATASSVVGVTVRDATVVDETTGPIQYSDAALVTAVLADAVVPGPVSGRSLLLSAGSSSGTATTDTNGRAVLPIPVGLPAGSTLVTGASFAGDAHYLPASGGGSVTVVAEDADVEYSGDTLATGTVARLAATVTEAADGSLGDITKASVTFDVYAGATACGSGAPTRYGPIAVVDTGTVGDGIGTAEYTMSTPAEQTYCIVVRLTGAGQASPNPYYSAIPAQGAVLTVVSTTGKFATGGGWIVDPVTGRHGNFGFTARFMKNGAPKGQAVYVWRATVGGILTDFIVKSSSISAMSFADQDGTGTFPWRATLSGKATIRAARASNGTELWSDGNATFTLVAVDSGESSGRGVDSFALRVIDKSGATFRLVGSWSGSSWSAGVLLSGGNVVVHLD